MDLPDRPGTYFDGSPAYVKQAVEKSLKRLKIDTIDLYYAHRIDPKVPVEDMVGAMADLVKEGKFVTWVYQKHQPNLFAVHIKYILLPRCKANIRCFQETWKAKF